MDDVRQQLRYLVELDAAIDRTLRAEHDEHAKGRQSTEDAYLHMKSIVAKLIAMAKAERLVLMDLSDTISATTATHEREAAAMQDRLRALEGRVADLESGPAA